MEFEKGSIVELYEGAENKYIILNNMAKGDKQYILAAVWKDTEAIKDVIMQSMNNGFSDIVLIENDINTNSFKFFSDKNIIIEIVYKTLEEENMQDL